MYCCVACKLKLGAGLQERYYNNSNSNTTDNCNNRVDHRANNDVNNDKCYRD